MKLNRRKFLALGLGLGAGGWWLLKAPHSESVVARQSWALGSESKITVMGLPPASAERAIQAAFAELEAIENSMSLYRPESQLARLNRDRHLSQPDARLLTVLRRALAASEQTAGAFDITVQPLWAMYSAAKREDRSPTQAELIAARQEVDWRGVEVTSDSVRLNAPVTAITLNGIAQGFAADCVIDVLRQHGVKHALINAGEIGVLGRKPDGDAWTIGIQHPREPQQFLALAELEGRALATSGDYATSFSADFSTHHIFDPQTGASPLELASASLVAPTAMDADLLSTSAMVLGPERTLKLVASLPDVDALLVLKDGRRLQTPGFPEVS